MGREDDQRRETGDLSQQDEAATMTKTRSRPVPLRCADERRNLQDPIGGSLRTQATYMNLWATDADERTRVTMIVRPS
jgi:hypothetical protein